MQMGSSPRRLVRQSNISNLAQIEWQKFSSHSADFLFLSKIKTARLGSLKILRQCAAIRAASLLAPWGLKSTLACLATVYFSH